MHLVIPHKFTQQEATSRIKQLLVEAKPKIAGRATIEEERWDGNTLHFGVTVEGQQVTGQVAVEDKQFLIDAKLPFMLRLFEGRIEKTIQEQAAKMLG